MSRLETIESHLQAPPGGIYADGMCLPEEEVSEFHSPLVGEAESRAKRGSQGEWKGQTRAAANHHKFTSVIAGTSRAPSAVKSDPAKTERAKAFEMTANVLDFSRQLSPDQLVCREDQDATLALLDPLPISDFETLPAPSLLKGHMAPLQGLKVATLTLPEDLEVQQAGIGGLVVLIISLILAACGDGDENTTAISPSASSSSKGNCESVTSQCSSAMEAEIRGFHLLNFDYYFLTDDQIMQLICYKKLNPSFQDAVINTILDLLCIDHSCPDHPTAPDLNQMKDSPVIKEWKAQHPGEQVPVDVITEAWETHCEVIEN